MRRWRLGAGLVGLLFLANCAAVEPKASRSIPVPTSEPAAPVWRAPAGRDGFAGWAAVIVSGDWRAGSGGPSATFDNARRDLSDAFVRTGFAPANIRQFSARPDLAPGGSAAPARISDIAATLGRLMAQAGDGCLLYITSHGSEEGVLIGRDLIPPPVLASVLNSTCAGRPTVVVVSACHSGIFVSALSAPHRLVVAAARADRSSFGCSEDDRYPYFDACMLQELPSAPDFPALAEAARLCVARREAAENFLPSLPQISLGDRAAMVLRRLGLGNR